MGLRSSRQENATPAAGADAADGDSNASEDVSNDHSFPNESHVLISRFQCLAAAFRATTTFLLADV